MTTLPAGMTMGDLKDLIRESGVLDEFKAELSQEGPSEYRESADEMAAGLGSGGFPWAYWRKKDGRIITGPHPDYTETLLRTYWRKGYEVLPQYGKLPPPGAATPCCPNIQMKNQQFHVLMAHGGAKEMAPIQVVNAGWHLNPPVVHGKTITFPQLNGLNIESIECDECDKPVYGIVDRKQRGVVMILRQHCEVAHKFTRRDVDEMLARIAGRAVNEQGPVVQAVLARENSFICEVCGRGFPLAVALSGHRRSHRDGSST